MARVAEKSRKGKVSPFEYCVLHQKVPFSSQTFQGATGTSLCRILDRDTALESSNAELYDGAHPQVCAHIRHIVMSTQQAQKTHFLHDVPFVCHMCADHFATSV